MFNNKSILVTGGTGSFGKAFIKYILDNFPSVARIIVFSRDELKQYEMEQKFPEAELPAMRYFVGDIRDKDRLIQALEGVDFVVHAAAMKHVPIAEFNPFECIKTNIIGAQNLIEACIFQNVSKVVALSTDKAAAPINLYGATKLCSDKMFVAANNVVGARPLSFSVVRYGNVFGSRGSVVPFFLKRLESGVLPITDPSMTRFSISLEQGVELVSRAFKDGVGGEIYVPKIPSYLITDLAKAIGPTCEQRIVGIRPGEKLHEEMITLSDGANVVDLGDHLVILPSADGKLRRYYCENLLAKEVEQGFSYSSNGNPHFLSVEQLTDLVREFCAASE